MIETLRFAEGIPATHDSDHDQHAHSRTPRYACEVAPLYYCFRRMQSIHCVGRLRVVPRVTQNRCTGVTKGLPKMPVMVENKESNRKRSIIRKSTATLKTMRIGNKFEKA